MISGRVSKETQEPRGKQFLDYGSVAEWTRCKRVRIWWVSKETREPRGKQFLDYGSVAEWLGKGLQNLLQQFNSAPNLKEAQVANLD